MDNKETGCKLDSVGSEQGAVHKLSDYQLLRDSVPWKGKTIPTTVT
jgi:hypothetical protein